MTLEVRYCPTCGTRRTGFFRFCGRCGFDFDDLTVTRPSDDPAAPPRPEQPTTPIWPPPVQWPPPDALPTTQVVAARAVQASTPQTAPSIAAVAAAPSTPAAPVTPAEPPDPGCGHGARADRLAAARSAPRRAARCPRIDRSWLARSPFRTGRRRRRRQPSRRRSASVADRSPRAGRPSRGHGIAIVGLAAVLAVSAIAKAISPSSSIEPTPLPTVVLGSPLVGGSPPGVVVPTPAPTLPEIDVRADGPDRCGGRDQRSSMATRSTSTSTASTTPCATSASIRPSRPAPTPTRRSWPTARLRRTPAWWRAPRSSSRRTCPTPTSSVDCCATSGS